VPGMNNDFVRISSGERWTFAGRVPGPPFGEHEMRIPSLLAMAVGFRARLFAAGAGLVSVPIVIHLLNRRRYRVVQWAAMDYLLAGDEEKSPAAEIREPAAAADAMRGAAAAGLALARPFGCQNNAGWRWRAANRGCT
jgi:hypothetical protein